MEHEDSAGHKGALGSGDVQWMTAGSGVVHSELPSRRFMERGGRMHGFQIWVNLPARDKMMPPRYQEIPRAQIPAAQTPDGLARVQVIAGQALGVHAAIETRTPILYHDWTLLPGASVDTDVPADFSVFAYVFGGECCIGPRGTVVQDGQLARLDAGDVVRLACPTEASVPARLLLLGGVPLNEPVARYGPFVMNTEREIYQAVDDYQQGRMGHIVR
jgi:quercetin 2,3-dioxygenase